MIALDTNILARYLLKDDETQFERARALLDGSGEYAVPVTVFLELVWVLRVNGCKPEEIARGLRLLIGLPNFKPRNLTILLYALKWYEEGMDFADPLHLAQSDQEQGFITFDRDFAEVAKQAGAFPSVQLA
ncbi:MAG: type II toxin-antitoxin system VapC family toxin [Betaproteobacteria bacterium]|nr:type II toxin-antitoxin system VapC family toxin [Betaproteobacteria bacterium]